MALNKKDVYLDFTTKDLVTILCTQYDKDSRTYTIHFLDDGKPFLINKTNRKVMFKMTKKDNKKVLDDCAINSDGTVNFELTEQICVFHGIYDVQFVLFDSNDMSVVYTMPFRLNITKSVTDNVEIESSDEFNALNNMILKETERIKIVEELEKKITEAETIRVNNEEVRKSNENTRISNENNRINAENIRVANENIRIKNENVRKANEVIRQDQETNRQANTATAIKNAEAATKRANDATDDLQNKLNSHHFVLTEDKDVAGGVPSLDSNTKIPISELYEATTKSKGIIQLTDSVTSTSTTTAATPNSVKTVNDALTTEKSRATSAESTLTTNLNTEITRATNSESTITSNLNSEILRAKNAESELNSKKAPLASPTLTGTPKAPTASAGTNTTQIATTAFTQTAVSSHNISPISHSDIRDLITGLTTRLNALADSDDTTLDQLSEIVAYIKSNRSLIESVTTNKVNVSDVINNLTSTSVDKPLAANQGKVLKELIDTLTSSFNAHKNDTTVHTNSTERANFTDAYNKRHTHGNKSVIDGITSTLVNNWNSAKTHADSSHARTDATNVAKSTTNGNILINGTETNVYTHPSGTNPHGTTKSDVGLGNVPNVATNDQTPSYTEATSLAKLSSGEKLSVAFSKISKAITDLISHIGDSVKHITSSERIAWNSAYTHSTSTHAPSNAQANVIEIVKVNGSALTPSSKAVNVTVPTKVSQLTNDSGYKTTDNNTTYSLSKSGSTITLTGSDGSKTSVSDSDTNTTYPIAYKTIDGSFITKYRTQTKGNTANGDYISTIRTEASGVNYAPQFGSGLAWGRGDTHGYLYTAYPFAEAYLGGGNADTLNWVKRIQFTDGTGASGTWGINITGNANTATSLGGYPYLVGSTGKDSWGTVPVINGSDGVMEVGKYIDFHASDGSKVDYDVRIIADVGGLTITGTTSGTFTGNLLGNATTATALTSSAGNSQQPVYFSGGKPVACTYTLGKSVPSNAVFTDTWRGIQNNLISTSTTDSLSAFMGKQLKSMIDTLITTGYYDTMWSNDAGSMNYYIRFSTGIMIMVTIIPDGWSVENNTHYIYPVSFINNNYALIAVDNTSTNGQTNGQTSGGFDRRIPMIRHERNYFTVWSNSVTPGDDNFYNEGIEDSMSVICIGRWK